jgi:hypothetical protein
LPDLGDAQHEGEFLGHFEPREALAAPGHVEGDGVEELGGGDKAVDALGDKRFCSIRCS